jgi:hypothetical protein
MKNKNKNNNKMKNKTQQQQERRLCAQTPQPVILSAVVNVFSTPPLINVFWR